MNATDLMIGDWVITLDGALKRITRRDFEDNDFERYFSIPITPEILEGNGFMVNKMKNPACYSLDLSIKNDNFTREQKVSIEVFAKSAKADATGLILCTIGYADDCNKVIQIELRYIHELQHALKLCGITKDIIL